VTVTGMLAGPVVLVALAVVPAGRMLTFGIFQPTGTLAAGTLAEHVAVGWTLALCGLPMLVIGAAGLTRTAAPTETPVRSW
jgi:hypothetical protein